jgi:8-oxo-dGTP diphosphatase
MIRLAFVRDLALTAAAAGVAAMAVDEVLPGRYRPAWTRPAPATPLPATRHGWLYTADSYGQDRARRLRPATATEAALSAASRAAGAGGWIGLTTDGEAVPAGDPRLTGGTTPGEVAVYMASRGQHIESVFVAGGETPATAWAVRTADGIEIPARDLDEATAGAGILNRPPYANSTAAPAAARARVVMWTGTPRGHAAMLRAIEAGDVMGLPVLPGEDGIDDQDHGDYLEPYRTAGENVRLTADVVLIATRDGEQHVLLIQRGWPPFEGRWALPGGHVDAGEAVDATARRELAEETGVRADRLDLVGVYATPGRDPRGRYITWAFTTTLPALPELTAGDDARDARWVPVTKALANPDDLAFDHAQILTDALLATGAGVVDAALDG